MVCLIEIYWGILLVVIRADETQLVQVRLAEERWNMWDGSSQGKCQDSTGQIHENVISSRGLRIVHV
jgi:hypothetical protein